MVRCPLLVAAADTKSVEILFLLLLLLALRVKINAFN
jgi:hypothetical protein